MTVIREMEVSQDQWSHWSQRSVEMVIRTWMWDLYAEVDRGGHLQIECLYATGVSCMPHFWY
jgi:hypothetical protein